MKDRFILKKAKEKQELSKSIANTNAPVEVARVSSPNDFTLKYKEKMRNIDLDSAKKL